MGHPDKICDQISDAILDSYLQQDKNSRVAVESLIKNNNIVVAGEVSSNGIVNINKTIENVLKDIGIEDNWNIINMIDQQSPDIAQGVDVGGAGDQGIMFGYACDETPELLPLSYVLATQSLLKLRELNHKQLKPDAKSQVTVQYDKDNQIKIHTFLISTQHTEDISNQELYDIVSNVMFKTAKEYNMNTDFKVLINPTGRFVVGGSYGDCGVTGRKIIADTYGGYGRHGGGAFSGKDYTKVDRSGAYMARYLAKYLLKKYKLKDCEVQLAYAIGVKEPVSIDVVGDRENLPFVLSVLKNDIKNNFDLTPDGIFKFLKLDEVKYYKTSKYGHFTNQTLPWENV